MQLKFWELVSDESDNRSEETTDIGYSNWSVFLREKMPCFSCEKTDEYRCLQTRFSYLVEFFRFSCDFLVKLDMLPCLGHVLLNLFLTIWNIIDM